MSWTRFFRRRYWDQERARELDAYLEAETDDNIARGMSPEEARYAAHRKLGNTTLIREEIYHMNSLGWVETLWQDLRFSLRMLRKNPGFTTAAVITLALGIGANTAIFSVVSSILIHPLPYSDPRFPYSDPDRLVWITEYWPQISEIVGSTPVVIPDYLHWREQNQVFQTVAAYGFGRSGLDLRGNGELERVDAIGVTWNFFPMLGVRPALGRSFLPESL